MKTEKKYKPFYYLLFILVVLSGFTPDKKNMSVNKQTVMDYMDAFNAGDHAKILACLTDDIVWEMPGVYHHSGKAAFDKEIENEAFVGRPTIKIIRLVEESDVVVAEDCTKQEKGWRAIKCGFLRCVCDA